VLAIDTEKRQIKLSMKQLIPTSIDEYIAEHKAGDKVSGASSKQTPRMPPSSWAKAFAPNAGSPQPRQQPLQMQKSRKAKPTCPRCRLC